MSEQVSVADFKNLHITIRHFGKQKINTHSSTKVQLKRWIKHINLCANKIDAKAKKYSTLEKIHMTGTNPLELLSWLMTIAMNTSYDGRDMTPQIW